MVSQTQEIPVIKKAEQQPKPESPEAVRRRAELSVAREVSPGAQKAKERLDLINDMAESFRSSLDAEAMGKIEGWQRELNEMSEAFGSEIKNEINSARLALSDARRSITKAQEVRRQISRQPDSVVRAKQDSAQQPARASNWFKRMFGG
ncbi:hypothetical protein HZB94_04355 [Candidatus Falkowbacteria bacterium]|nr:hypothetical protein [Candidatus Falkowbacteria bacterium]